MRKIMLTIAVAIAVGFIGFTFSGSATEVQANSIEPIASTSTITSTNTLGDTCKQVKFKFTNKHSKGGEIEIRAVKYYNKANGKWQTEDVPNAVVNQGSSYTTGGDDLQDSEGEDLTQIIFVYRWKAVGRGAAWSSDVSSKIFVPTEPSCYANRTYGAGKTIFTIG